MIPKSVSAALNISVLPGWRGRLFLLGIGAVMALGLAPFSLPYFAIPALCWAVYGGLAAPTARRATGIGGFIGFGYALGALFWIVEPFLVDAATYGWMAPFALFFMALGFSLFWAIGFGLAARFSPAFSAERAVFLVAFWTGAELLRGYAFTGFPWGMLAYVWIDTPAYQIAAATGPYGLTMLTLTVVAAFVYGLHQRSPALTLAAVLALCLGVAGGFWRSTISVPKPDHPATVRLIQPNAEQKLKWDPQWIPTFFDRQLKLTAEPGDPMPDIVIWPEVAVPFLLDGSSQPFGEIAAAADTGTVILGAQRLDQRLAFNSLAVLGPDGAPLHVYDKQHLVPFGEYLPGGAWLGQIGIRALAAQQSYGYTAGTGAKTLDLGRFGVVQPLICYEGIFPEEVRDVAQRPDWMLLITNDAWFGKFSGPYQHLAQAQARSTELGLPMIRVANTGVSAVIDAHGRILDDIPQGVAGRLDAPLPGKLPPTIYARFGDIPVISVLIVLFLVGFALRQRNRIDPSQPGV